MKILIAASDLTPLFSPESRRVAGPLPALPAELARGGHEVSVAGPWTPVLDALPTMKMRPTGVQISLPLGHDRVSVEVRETKAPGALQTFMFRHDATFGKLERPLAEANHAQAATLFSKLVIELARRLNPAPDVVVVLDWPGALAPVFGRAQNLPFASVILVGNPAAQGSFPIEEFGLLNLGWEYFRPEGVEFFGRVNFLKSGILYADGVIADGELDRDALLTPAGGGGLDGVFRENAGKLRGIPAGVDDAVWNPGTDAVIPRKYRPANLVGKVTSRNVVLAEHGLTKNPVGPVFLLDRALPQDAALVGVLAERINEWLADDVRVFVLGEAARDEPSDALLQIAAKRHPAKLALVPEADDRTRHMALAAADFQLFLGRGLGLTASLLRSLRYGALPIAPAGMGLRQVIEDYQPGGESGQALIFYHATGEALFDAVAHRAPALLEPADRWEGLRQQAMIHGGGFSWSRAAGAYAEWFGQLRR